MNISGIRPNTAFYTNNTIQNQGIQENQRSEAAADTKQASQKEDGTRAKTDEQAVRQEFHSGDYAVQYLPGESHSLKGKDSDLANLDMEKAISSMQKDKAIQQYQFFVGEKKMQSQIEQNVIQRQAVEDFTVL